jgi:hypothetical protein
MSTLLTQVVEATKTLPEAHLRKVLEFVIELKGKTIQETTSQSVNNLTLLERLLQAGLIDELPDLEATNEPELEPISYTGKPLSEIIIEERNCRPGYA